jgi:hypothetical protein
MAQNASSKSKVSSQGVWDLGALVSLVVLAALFGNSFYGGQKGTVNMGIVGTSEVSNNVDRLIGETVTIKGKATQKVGLSSFSVSDGTFGRRSSILVINASGVPFNLPDDPNLQVQVTGKVRKLVIPDIEREYKLNLQDEYYNNFVNQPVIVAQYITIASK